jgi:hypothetical protein
VTLAGKQHTELTIFAKMVIPDIDKELFFGGQGIKLSHNGDIIGDASLLLLDSVTIPIHGNNAALTLVGNYDTLSGRAKEELTYVSIDCKGFREMGISAFVEFPRSLIKPVDEEGNELTETVKASFRTIVQDWSDLLVNISLPPFEINGLKGFIFSVHSATFDYSDLRNSPDILFPKDYQLNYLIPGHPSLWRGVFVKDVTVSLPKQFSFRQSEKRVSFEAHDMLLDENGISGIFKATGILPIDQGSASGWRFSVDALSIALEANTLIGAGFSGEIGLPVSEKSNLAYEALITANDEYYLKVKSISNFSFDVFHARALLKPNSYVLLRVIDDQFRPEALLHGSLSFEARLGSTTEDSTGTKIGDFEEIEFRSLRLKTDAPQFTAEYFGYKGEIKIMNFPVSVQRIGFRSTEHEVALGMDLKLTLSDNLFTGTTRIEIVGAKKESVREGEAAQWKYKTFEISKVAVNAEVAEVFSLKGELMVLNADPVYGNGFGGDITLTLNKVLKGCDIKSRAIFGKTSFRYWMVDGKISFPEGLKVFGPVSLKGIAGGASKRMRREGGELLESPTGAVYRPDENTGLGIKAGILFNVANDAAVSGEASFEIAFNRSGGLNFIGIYGFAKFLGKIPGAGDIEKFVSEKYNKIVEKEKQFVGEHGELVEVLDKLKQYDPGEAAKKVFTPSERPGEAGFSAAVGIQYDFTENSLHATFDLYVNAIKGVIRGTASGNRAGWAVIHMDLKEWYLHMGTPTDRIGLKMGIGNILSVETGAYLMLGSRIPGSPPPPQQVADILGLELSKLDYMRDLNALGDGKGFAFGASLSVATGDITFLILYANFQAGMGFDIMLKDYGDAQCRGRSGKIGIDGWYANGQAYAYLQGELGVKVNLWFVKAKIPIIKGAAAALLQAKLPDPAWFRGYLGVKFSVLGGLVSGRCRFKFTIGEECDIIMPGGSPVDILMISDISPKNNTSEVDVFTAPTATFTMRVGVPFQVEDDYGIKHYRIHLNEFIVLDEGKPIEGRLVWTQEKDAVSFYSHEVLPPQKNLKAIVKVGFQSWQAGKWATVYTAGIIAQEIKEFSFTTGTAPDVIPIHNVQYSYPVVSQKFFLKDESTKGFIQLKRGQSYLFKSENEYEIHITTEDGSRQNTSFAYNSATSRIDYQIPSLALQQRYGFDVVLLSSNGNPEVPVVAEQTQNLGDEENEITLTNKQATNVIRTDIGKSLLNYEFVTSRYGTFQQKLTSIKKTNAIAGYIASDVINLKYEIAESEPFELSELKGTEFTDYKPLVLAEAILSDAYYNEDIYPITYKNYPFDGISLSRDASLLGIPPVKALPISTEYLTEIHDNNFQGIATKRFPYIYNLPQVYKQDFLELQNKVVNKFLETPQQMNYEYIINGHYKFIRQGYYTVKLQYMLPDNTKGSEGVFEYYNFIK